MRLLKHLGQLVAALILISPSALATQLLALKSPNQQLTTKVVLSDKGTLSYQVQLKQETVLSPSRLGISLNNSDFASGLKLHSVSDIVATEDHYSLFTGKQSQVNYLANSATITLANSQQQLLAVRFQLSNDGLAFRYELLGESDDNRVVTSEHTHFNFPKNTVAWLQPKAQAQTGWMNTNPSYEEEYLQAVPLNTAQSTNNGWVFPALFKHNDSYILLSEASVPSYYSATNLSNDANGRFAIRFPDPQEVITNGGYLPEHTLPFVSPWRLVVVGNLKTVTESTLGTDVAKANQLTNTDFIKPGIAAWSWGLLKDDYTTFPVQQQFIDYAADMNWHYVLVDADWDKKIGVEKLTQLANQAKQKGVALWVWYNSSGAWNNTVYSPKSALLSRSDRKKHFAMLQRIGVKGIKVDFFPGDGSSVMAYYETILQDAAEFELMVNFHGTTLPRGLQRTYPNLMTSEAVKGFEMISFFQDFADKEAEHATTLVFTRNVFDPMDFTPMVLGDIPNIKRKTNNAFQLALPVLFTSGVQHLVTIPSQMDDVSEATKQYLRNLPARWDETRLLAGDPGKYAVFARRAGCDWYIAGISNESRNFDLDLGFTNFKTASLFSAGKSLHDVTTSAVKQPKVSIKLDPNSGFVLTVKSEKNNECTAPLAQ